MVTWLEASSTTPLVELSTVKPVRCQYGAPLSQSPYPFPPEEVSTAPRPRGSLRAYATPRLTPLTGALAAAPARLIADPDGRPRHLRRARVF